MEEHVNLGVSLPIERILTFGTEEVDVILELQLEDEILVHAVRFRWERTLVAQ